LCAAYGTLDHGLTATPPVAFVASHTIAAPAPIPAGQPLSAHTHFRSRAPPALV
jgi:hypothetical protein